MNAPAAQAIVAAQCDVCNSNLRYPIEWQQAMHDRWIATLRCPNCDTRSKLALTEDAIEIFDCALDRGTDELVRELRNLTYANFAREVNHFVDALNADAILPFDFGIPAQPITAKNESPERHIT